MSLNLNWLVRAELKRINLFSFKRKTVFFSIKQYKKYLEWLFFCLFVCIIKESITLTVVFHSRRNRWRQINFACHFLKSITIIRRPFSFITDSETALLLNSLSLNEENHHNWRDCIQNEWKTNVKASVEDSDIGRSLFILKFDQRHLNCVNHVYLIMICPTIDVHYSP